MVPLRTPARRLEPDERVKVQRALDKINRMLREHPADPAKLAEHNREMRALLEEAERILGIGPGRSRDE